RHYWSEYGIPAFEDHHHHEDEPEEGHDHDHAHEGVKIRMRRHTARGQAQIMSLPGPFVWLKLDGAYTDYRHEEVEAAGEVGTEFALRSATVDLQARHDRSAFDRSNGTTIGIQALWSDYRAGGSIALTPTKEYGLAAYLVDERSPSFLPSRVRLQIGARYDWRRVEPEREGAADIGVIRPRDFGAFTASVGALYDLADGFTLGASVSRAFRTPNANELFSEGPHLATYSYEVGNPDLEEETGLGVDVFLRIARERLRGEVAVFRNGIDDYIYTRNTGELSPTGLPVYQHVNGDAVLTGFEGSAQWRVSREFVVEGTVSYVRGTLTATDEPLPQIPPLQGRVGARYETQRFFVAAGWRGAARQDRTGEFETPTDGYGIFDASAGYRWPVGGQLHTLTLRVDNITDEVYRDHLSRIKEIMPQAGGGATLLYGVNFGGGRGRARRRARASSPPHPSRARPPRAFRQGSCTRAGDHGARSPGDNRTLPNPRPRRRRLRPGRGRGRAAAGADRGPRPAAGRAVHHAHLRPESRRQHRGPTRLSAGAQRRRRADTPPHAPGDARRGPRRRRNGAFGRPAAHGPARRRAGPAPDRRRFARAHARRRAPPRAPHAQAGDRDDRSGRAGRGER